MIGLGVYLNSAAQTTLNGAINASTTTVTVHLVGGSPAGTRFRIRIDDEIMLITAQAGGGVYTVVRGAESSVAASHLDAAPVRYLRTGGPLADLAYEIQRALDGSGGAPPGTGIVRVTSGVYGTPGNVVESEITLADNTTNDASISAHGFLKKLPGGTTTYLRADGTFAAPPGGSGGSGWVLITSWAYSSNVAYVDFTGLGGYEEILLVLRLVTMSSVCTKFVRYSTDNGATFDATVGNYNYVNNQGTESEDGTHAFAIINVDSSGAKSGFAHIFNWNSTSPKICTAPGQNPNTQIWPVASALNALRVLGGISGITTTGNFTGGNMYVFGR